MNRINKYYGQTIKAFRQGIISQAVYEGTTGLSGTVEQKQYGEVKLVVKALKQGLLDGVVTR